MLRSCLRDPVAEIYQAANYLDSAVTAHLQGDRARAEALIRLADMPEIACWTESLWGPGGPWSRPVKVDTSLPLVVRDQRSKERMPTTATKTRLLERDGYHCRFCGIPVIRKEIRDQIKTCYPQALRWGNANREQHAAFQAMWVQYDHIVPHARGGSNDLDNMLITCAPCNYGRSNLTLEEVGLADPRTRSPVRTSWDGLERFAASRSIA